MNSLTFNDDSLKHLIDNIEQQTRQIKDEIKKIDNLIAQEPVTFKNRLEKLEYKTKIFDLINKKFMLAFKLSLLTTDKNFKSDHI